MKEQFLRRRACPRATPSARDSGGVKGPAERHCRLSDLIIVARLVAGSGAFEDFLCLSAYGARPPGREGAGGFRLGSDAGRECRGDELVEADPGRFGLCRRGVFQVFGGAERKRAHVRSFLRTSFGRSTGMPNGAAAAAKSTSGFNFTPPTSRRSRTGPVLVGVKGATPPCRRAPRPG